MRKMFSMFGAVLFSALFSITGFADEAEEASSPSFSLSNLICSVAPRCCYEPCDTMHSCDSPSSFCLTWIPTVVYRGGPGRSYRQGFEGGGGMIVAYNEKKRSYPFLDLNFWRVGRGRLATNMGFGWRKFSCDYSEMFGINLYYDSRRRRGSTLQEVGVGLELLGRCWDLRANAYIPFGNKRVFVNESVFDFTGPFAAVRSDYKAAMWGIDVEVGKTFCCTDCWDLYLGVGPYIYNSEADCSCNTMVGGMGRATVSFCHYLMVSFFYTYDHVYNSRPQGEIRLRMPFPCAIKCWQYLFPPVWRNPVLMTEDLSCWKSFGF